MSVAPFAYMYNLSMYNVYSIILHVYISVCGGELPEWNIALIVLGVIFFIVGVVIAVILYSNIPAQNVWW